jgi:hypothetical protein
MIEKFVGPATNKGGVSDYSLFPSIERPTPLLVAPGQLKAG